MFEVVPESRPKAAKALEEAEKQKRTEGAMTDHAWHCVYSPTLPKSSTSRKSEMLDHVHKESAVSLLFSFVG